MDELKKCSKCKSYLPANSFNKRAVSKDGLRGTCRNCDREDHANYRAANREKNRIAKNVWKKSNREKINAGRRRFYKKNSEKIKATVVRWQKKNPEKVKAWMKKWKDNNPEKIFVSRAKAFFTRGTPLISSDIPQELIEAKRTHLKLVRKLKEK